MSLGHLGVGAGSAVRSLVDFGLIFRRSRRPLKLLFCAVGTPGIENMRFRTSYFRLIFVIFAKEEKINDFALPGVPIGTPWGENLKILKIFIFWYFDFVERLYIITYGPDMFIARGPARGSRSLYFILAPKVDPI